MTTISNLRRVGNDFLCDFTQGDVTTTETWGRNPGETLVSFKTRVVAAVKEHKKALEVNDNLTVTTFPDSDLD